MQTLEKFFNRGLDNETEKWLMKEYFYILQITGAFQYMRGKWIFISIFSSFLYHAVILLGGSQIFIAAIVIIKDEFGMALFMLHCVSGCVLMTIIVALYKIKRCEMAKCFTILYRGFKYNKNYNAKNVKLWIKDERKYRKYFISFFAFIFIAIGMHVIFINDVINKIEGKEVVEMYNGNVYMKTAVPIWFPFRLDESYAHLVFYPYTVLGDFILLLWVFISILFTYTVLNNVNIELKKLIDSIFQIEERSLKNCIDKYKGYKELIDMGMLYQDKKFLKEYELSLKENFKHHQNILSVKNCINNIITWPMFITTFNISVGMACGVVTVVQGNVRISTVFVSTLLLAMEIFSISAICGKGQEMIDLGDELFASFYNLRWLDLPVNIKKLIIIFQEKTKNPMAYQAGMYRIDWIYFTTIINMAYTFCTILIAMK